MACTFIINEKEEIRIKEYLDEHKKTCPYLGHAAKHWFGSPIHYIFTPSEIGNSVEVLCNCGNKVDVTDLDSW